MSKTITQDDAELLKLYNEKLELGTELIKQLEFYKKIDGVPKIQRRINQELKFLTKVKITNQLKLNHILCSNLIHYKYLINTLKRSRNILNVDYPLMNNGNGNRGNSSFINTPSAAAAATSPTTNDDDDDQDPAADEQHRNQRRTTPLRIDIICDNGETWIKVIARNTKSIIDSVHGRNAYGSKSILDQAREYQQLAIENPCCFKAPRIIFEFAHPINDDSLVNQLMAYNIIVNDNLQMMMADDDDGDGNGDGQQTMKSISDASVVTKRCYSSRIDAHQIDKLNLDITTLIAYVSAISNGNSNWKFIEPILNEQSEWERKRPVKPILDELFKGKQLICCQTAVDSFMEICDMLAGINERKRATEFLNRIEILPDIYDDDCKSNGILKLKLPIGGKIKARSLQIFSFGLAHQARTVTSNEGFIRSAKMQGIDIPVFVHEARALTEQKQLTGTLITI